MEGPVHTTELLLNCGVTVIVPDIGALVALVAVKPKILPVPLAGMPMAGLLFVHDIIFIPPVVDTVKFTGGMAAPLQTTWSDTGVIVGVGLTVILNVVGVPVQVIDA